MQPVVSSINRDPVALNSIRKVLVRAHWCGHCNRQVITALTVAELVGVESLLLADSLAASLGRRSWQANVEWHVVSPSNHFDISTGLRKTRIRWRCERRFPPAKPQRSIMRFLVLLRHKIRNESGFNFLSNRKIPVPAWCLQVWTAVEKLQGTRRRRTTLPAARSTSWPWIH